MKKTKSIYLKAILFAIAGLIYVSSQSVHAQLPQRVTGLQLKSPFGMSIAGEPAEKVAVGNDLGIKWVRGTGSDFTQWNGDKQEIKNRIITLKNGGIMPINICFYPAPWIIPGKLGPPADMNAYVEKFYNMVDAAYDLCPYYEHWNEPWVDEWAWNGGSDQLYRDMIKQIWNRVKPTHPNAMLIGGGSTAFNRDIMYPKGNTDMGYTDGSICHAYGFPNNNAVGTIANQLELDKKYSKSQGIAGAFQTEFGTYPGMYATDKLLWVGRSVAPSYLSQMLAGFYAGLPVKSFWFNYGSDGDFSIADNTVAKNAIRTMTLILEGTKITADAYPKSKAINGIVFANDYSNDTRARATIYVSSPYVGGDATARDPYNNTGTADMPSDEFSGTVSITNANNMQAYDYVGNRITDLNNIPMVAGEVVYLLANMTSDEMKNALTNVNFNLKNEIKVTPLSMDGPVIAGRTIDFKFENLVNKVRSVNFSFTPPSGFTMASTSSTFDLQVGEIRTVRFKINNASANANNLYNLSFSATTNSKTITKNWTIQSAYAPKKTMNVDGNLSDWASIAPTTMGGGNYTMRLAWDDNNLYFAAEIADDTHAPYPIFKSGDFEYFRTNRFDYVNKDGIIMAFDVMKNNPDDLLKNYPNYEKACAADVDYQFFAQYAQGNVPEIVRYQAPGSNYQGFYPLTPTSPAIKAINASTAGGTEGKVNFLRSGNKTIYEGAIAWNTIPELRDSVRALGANGYCDPSFAWKVNSGNSGDKFWTTESGQMEDGTYGFYPAWISGQFGNGGRIITRWSFINGDGNFARPGGCTGIPVTGVSLNQTTLSVNTGSSSTLTATLSPSNACTQGVNWSSSNSSVATVSNGVVTGISAGTATITVTTVDGGKTATCAVTVTPISASSNIAPSGTASGWINLTAAANNDTKVAYTGLNDNNTSVDVVYPDASAAGNWQAAGIVWGAAQNNITSVKFYNGVCAALVNNGVFSAGIKIQSSTNGTTWADISGWACSPTYPYSTAASNQVYTFSGSALSNVMGIRVIGQVETNDSWSIKVKEVQVWAGSTTVTPTSVSISPSTASVVTGATTQLNATVLPSNATNKSVNWTTSSAAIATVSSTGLVTGVAAGNATITVTTVDGNKTATCAVTVTAVPSSNIATTGTAYAWQNLSAATGNGTKVAKPSLNNGNTTVTEIYPDVTAANYWQAGGVTWAAAQSNITSVKFYHGQHINNGSDNGCFTANLKVQSSTDGTIWVDAANWICTPAYPYNTTASLQSYTLSGAAINAVKGIRIVGQERTNDISWAVKLNEIEIYTGTAKSAVITEEAIKVAQDNAVMVYPNPVSNVLHITNAAANANISIYSIDGKLVTSLKSVDNETKIDVSGWNKGMYILSIQSNSQNLVTKLVVK